MPTQAELARKWEVTPSRISQLVREGCPITSFDAAEAWRANKAKKRTAANRIEKEDDRKLADENNEQGVRTFVATSKTGDSLEDALNNAIAVADAAYEDWQFARVNNLSSRTIRLTEHNKALDSRLKAEKAYREELERRSVLVNKTVVMDDCRRCMEAMLRRLKKLPNEKGPQCSTQDAIGAVRILDDEVANIIKIGREALNALK